jgi:hypothetical protein
VTVQEAPARVLGRTGASTAAARWGLDDTTEHVSDLQWPNSVVTYSRMRNDPTIGSVLAAYVHPIMRAPWHVDPRGAAPDVVQLVADSLGLPVLGQSDEPGPARNRGVRWRRHLRLALQQLVYGHYGFEPAYEYADGRVLLTGLPERLPSTITQIDTNTDGTLKAVRQSRDPGLTVASADDVVIPADRLLWYTHDREGDAWWGRSMLRACFGHWLIKQDTVRVAATGIRRWSAGIPVMEPLPGTNPTTAQVTEAARLAQSARAGDGAGAALPGWTLRIKGVEGTLPDPMPLLRYLDEQMARAALASVLDLGATPNGSRALGGTFADLLGDGAAGRRGRDRRDRDRAGRPADRLQRRGHRRRASHRGRRRRRVPPGPSRVGRPAGVSWCRHPRRRPRGVDPGVVRPARADRTIPAPSPLPPVGAQEPVTTQDAETKARRLERARASRLGREISRQLEAGRYAQEAGAGVDPEAAAELLAANRSRGAAQQASDWPYRRQLSAVEAKAGVDPVSIDEDAADLLGDVLRQWQDVTAAWSTALLDQVTALVDAGDLEGLAAMTLDVDDATAVVLAALVAAAAAGGQHAEAEADAQGVTVPAADPDSDALATAARATARILAVQLATSAGREALRLAGTASTGADVAGLVGEHLDGLTDNAPREVLGGAVAGGMNAGRAATFAAAGGGADFYASEIRDSNTCKPCRDIDGTKFDIPCRRGGPLPDRRLHAVRRPVPVPRDHRRPLGGLTGALEAVPGRPQRHDHDRGRDLVRRGRDDPGQRRCPRRTGPPRRSRPAGTPPMGPRPTSSSTTPTTPRSTAPAQPCDAPTPCPHDLSRHRFRPNGTRDCLDDDWCLVPAAIATGGT